MSYFNIEMIGVIKNEAGDVIGYRIVDGTVAPVNGYRPTKDTTEKNLIMTLKNTNTKINNLDLSDDKTEVVATNGAFSRYTELIYDTHTKSCRLNKDSEQHFVVLGKVGDDEFELCNAKGLCSTFSESDVIAFHKRNGLANATVVNTDGKEYIRSIRGEFTRVEKKSTKASKTASSMTKTKEKAEVKTETKAEHKEVVKPDEIKPSSPSEYKILTEIIDGKKYACGVSPKEYTGVIVIDKSIKGVSIRAFRSAHISGVIMENSVVDIGHSAFKDCRFLKNVKISDNVPFISARCFQNCTSLNRVYMGKSLERLHESCFESCESLESIDIPKNVSEVAQNSFRDCKRLVEVNHSGIKTIGQNAFRSCKSLEKFKFDGVYSIGTSSFRNTALKNVIITEDTYTVGNKAFLNCKYLKDIIIDEGVNSIGEFAFNTFGLTAQEKRNMQGGEYGINSIRVPKSVQNIGNKAFEECTTIRLYHGTEAEAYCKTFEHKIEYMDVLNEDNSLKARRKAEAFGLGGSIVSNIRVRLDNDTENVNNPEYSMTEKLINIPLTVELMKTIKIPVVDDADKKEPTIKYKALVNLITRASKVCGDPLTTKVFRFIDTLDIQSQLIYSDGWNRVYRLVFRTMDVLKEGICWLVLEGNTCRYITLVNPRNNFRLINKDYNDDEIPIEYLTTGDALGVAYSISGETERVTNDANVGVDMENRIVRNAISINIDSKNILYYIPSKNKAVHIVDEKEYDKKTNKLKEECSNRVKVKKIMDYAEFIGLVDNISRSNMNYEDYFSELRQASDEYAKYMSDLIKIVPEERVSQIYYVAKQCEQSMDRNGGIVLTKEIMQAIAESYWVVEKEVSWLDTVGKKSLNKIANYKCEEWNVVEYKSNQVVKFANPYITGGKGAYVLVLEQGGMPFRVLSSDRTLTMMLGDLSSMCKYNKNSYPTDIMGNYNEFKQIKAEYFYDFYDVLRSKNGWSLNNIKWGTYSRYTDYKCYTFNISMYKPTGVMYFTTKIYNREKYREKNSDTDKSKLVEYVVPLFKIGDLDRALYVAATTNTRAKDSQLANDLLKYIYVIRNNLMERMERTRQDNERLFKEKYEEMYDIYTRYTEARRLSLNGETDINKYDMVDERLKYMIGASAKGDIKPADRIYSLGRYELNIDN